MTHTVVNQVVCRANLDDAILLSTDIHRYVYLTNQAYPLCIPKESSQLQFGVLLLVYSEVLFLHLPSI